MNIEEQLSSVLNDPEAMSKISSIVSALGGGTQQQQSPPPLPQPQPQNEAHGQSQGQSQNQSGGMRLPDMSGDSRTKLLMALKPFLSEKRAPYVDSAVAILRMMQLGKLTGSLEPLMSAFGGGRNSSGSARNGGNTN
ncbi:MAG: hypothetical protein ACI4SS_04710 [Clostridia bacterium]